MAEGQFLGQKASYIYTSDNGSQYALYRDNDLALTEKTGLELYTVTSPFAYPLPRGFKPRGVYWVGVIGQRPVRKFIICGTQDSPLYISDVSQELIIDGVQGFIVSRIGERIRLVRRSATVPVP